MAWASKPGKFEEKLLPHLNAAYTLARWLMGSVPDGENAVQEAYVHALRFFNNYPEGDGRAWLIQIVHNTCYTRLRRSIPRMSEAAFEEEIESYESFFRMPETTAINADSEMARNAIDGLQLKYREILILRELEGMSYSEMGRILNEPLGNIRTRLFRARQQLKRRLIETTTRQLETRGTLPTKLRKPGL
jgi:RNA polymerase sigma-70 factor (ECF subfamily)